LEKRIRIPKNQCHDDKGSHDDNPTGGVSFFGKLHAEIFYKYRQKHQKCKTISV
jgi:hypothetical protein